MPRTITLTSSSVFSDAVLLLCAALCKLFSCGIHRAGVACYTFMTRMEQEEVTMLEMLLLMLVGIFIAHVLCLLGISG